MVGHIASRVPREVTESGVCLWKAFFLAPQALQSLWLPVSHHCNANHMWPSAIGQGMGNSKVAGQDSSYDSFSVHNKVGRNAGAFCRIEYSGSHAGVAS